MKSSKHCCTWTMILPLRKKSLMILSHSTVSKLRYFHQILYRRLVWNRCNCLWCIILGVNGSRLPWHYRLPLQKQVRPLCLCLLLFGRISFDTVDKFFPRSRQRNMLGADVDSFFDVAVANTFVNDDADSGFSDIVDNARLAVIDLAWHSLLYGAVDLDVYNIADPVSSR